MRRLTDRVFNTFRRIDGARFSALLTAPQAGGVNTTGFRILRVRNPCFLLPGDIVGTFGAEKIILMQHPSSLLGYTDFKAAYATIAGSWKRQAMVNDPVSGVKREAGWVNMGDLYLNFDTPSEVPMGVLADTRYRFITGQDVKVGDKVGTKVIKTLHDILGVKLGFAE